MTPIILIGPHSHIFIGPLGPGQVHTHAANAGLVALEKPFLLKIESEQIWKTYESTLIAAGTAHELNPQNGWCAVIYSDIYAPRWQAMQPAPGQPPIERLAACHELKAVLEGLIRVDEPHAELIRRLGNALEKSLGATPQHSNRMQQALKNHLQENNDLNLDELASSMHLSTSRVQHLFLSELGVSYKRLQHWVRFRGAMRQFEKLNSLTDAALECGFSDSSHFSNAFKSMFGVSARDAGISLSDARFWQTPW